MTIAFALSGGGNRGPLQIGALQSLLEHGIRPDFLVGTSAGSLNSAFTAAYGPDLSAIPKLTAAWHMANKKSVYSGNILTIAWRVLTGGNSVFSSDGVRRLIEANLPSGITTFGQLKCPCYVTAADLRSRRLFLFGEDPAAPLIDAIVASSSVPVVHPPVDYHGLQLADGGVIATAPAGVAMDKGATVIYSVNLGSGAEVEPPVHGILNIVTRTLDTFMAQSLFEDLQRATNDPAIELHHIHITAFGGLPFDDFDHIDEMIAAGKAATDAYLANPQPGLVQQLAAPEVPSRFIAGAREYTPPRRR